MFEEVKGKHYLIYITHANDFNLKVFKGDRPTNLIKLQAPKQILLQN